MQREYSSSWKSSTQPRKQRKFRVNAPLHVRRNLLSANLSKEMRKKYMVRNAILKKGDRVKIMRGQHKGKSGKIERISIGSLKVFITGIDIVRKDGTKSLIAIEPSKVQIIEMDVSDKRRLSKGEKNGKESS